MLFQFDRDGGVTKLKTAASVNPTLKRCNRERSKKSEGADQQQGLLHESGCMCTPPRCSAGAERAVGPGPLHHSRRRSILLEFLGHEAHVRIDVMKEMLVPRAEIIQPVFTRSRFRETMLGALAVAGETHIARLAIGGKPNRFVLAESCLLRRAHQRVQ